MHRGKPIFGRLRERHVGCSILCVPFKECFVNYTKIAAELVVDPREVLEARPRSVPPMDEVVTQGDGDSDACEDERWDNAPCTD
jgi:hypothetical protein